VRHFAVRLMITLEDCIALCGLTEAQVLAIAEHEHLPETPPAPSLNTFRSKGTAWRKSET
jgi:hypothetical protein